MPTWFVSFACRKAGTADSFLARWDALDAPDAAAAEAEYRRRKAAEGYEVGEPCGLRVIRSELRNRGRAAE